MTADSVEVGSIPKSVTPEERQEMQGRLAQVSINKAVLEEKLAEIKQEYKNDIDPLKAEQKELITVLKTNVRVIEGSMFHIHNQVSGLCEIYSENGELLDKRMLQPHERQTTLMSSNRTGTEE